MSDTFVTFHGWVGNEVVHRNVRDVSVANFRVASTPRIKRKGEWMDGDTTWYSVSAWRSLADNIAASVQKGDAVIVHGRLRSEAWKREDGHISNTLIVEASFVGHDLTRGTTSFTRSSRPERNDNDDDVELREMMHRQPDAGAVDSWGNPVAVPGDDGKVAHHADSPAA